MFFDDHKKHANTIVSKRNEKGEQTMNPTEMKAEEVSTEDGETDGRHLAAQDIIAAHHEKSPKKLMEALANFIDLHDAHEYDTEDAEEEE